MHLKRNFWICNLNIINYRYGNKTTSSEYVKCRNPNYIQVQGILLKLHVLLLCKYVFLWAKVLEMENASEFMFLILKGFWFYCSYGVGFICAWWMAVLCFMLLQGLVVVVYTCWQCCSSDIGDLLLPRECSVPQQRKHGQGSLLYMLTFKPIPNLNQRYLILTSQMSYLTVAYVLVCATE